MEKPPFTLEDALEVQKRQLADWKSKLNNECYTDLEKYALASNKVITEPYRIIRGTDLSNFIENWGRNNGHCLSLLKKYNAV